MLCLGDCPKTIKSLPLRNKTNKAHPPPIIKMAYTKLIISTGGVTVLTTCFVMILSQSIVIIMHYNI